MHATKGNRFAVRTGLTFGKEKFVAAAAVVDTEPYARWNFASVAQARARARRGYVAGSGVRLQRAAVNDRSREP